MRNQFTYHKTSINIIYSDAHMTSPVISREDVTGHRINGTDYVLVKQCGKYVPYMPIEDSMYHERVLSPRYISFEKNPPTSRDKCANVLFDYLHKQKQLLSESRSGFDINYYPEPFEGVHNV